MEPAIFRIQDEDPLDSRAQAHSESGVRSPEYGVRNSFFGIRSSEWIVPQPRESVKGRDGTFEIPDSRCGRSFGIEGSSPFGIWNSSFGMDSFTAPEPSAEAGCVRYNRCNLLSRPDPSTCRA